MGASAAAAASALSTPTPCGNNTVPVVMMMNQATAQATIAPPMASMRSGPSSSAVTPLSTTLFWVRNIIHGAMVVPTVAMIRLMKAASPCTCGTTVACATSPQSGSARKAATM